MRTRTLLALTTVGGLLAGGCVATRETKIDQRASRGTGEDGLLSGSPGTCGHGTAFHSAMLVPGFETTDVISARLSPNERTVYISKAQAVGSAIGFDLFVASRASTSDPFGGSAPLAVNTSTDEFWPSPSADGLTMFYESGVRPDAGPGEISRVWYATRATAADPFGITANAFFDAPPTNAVDSAPYLLPSANTLYWVTMGRPGSTTSQDLWTADVSCSGEIGNPHRVAELSTDVPENFPVATDDNLELFFARSSATDDDTFVATRSATTLPWTAPARVTGEAGINTANYDWPSWISPDACRLYFVRMSLGEAGFQSRLWVATRTPGEVAAASDVTCTYRREPITTGACAGHCSASPQTLARSNVPVRIHGVTNEYVIGGSGDAAYLASGGVRHAIDLDAAGPFSAFWSSGSTFSLAGDPPAEAYQPDVGLPPELKTSLAGTIAVTNAVETTVDLTGTRWPTVSGCAQNCVKDTIECVGTAVADRP